MFISDSVKKILIANKINLNTEKDYSGNDLLAIYEKVISFLDRKLTQAKIPDVVDTPCEENIEEQRSLILKDIETLSPSQISDAYSVRFFKSKHIDINYLAATLLCENADKFDYKIEQLWKDVMANGGNVPKNYEEKA